MSSATGTQSQLKVTTIRVDPVVFDLFKAKAAEEDRTASAQLRRLMAEFVRNAA